MSRLVSELAGAELDYWVARSQGWEFGPPHKVYGWDVWRFHGAITGIIPAQAYKPHEDWSQGGPLIEKHRICLTPASTPKYRGQWAASARMDSSDVTYAPTPLIAAMRVLVASVYGAEVPDEVAP